MGIKALKALKITFTSGDSVLVHAPRIRDMGVFFRAMPALIAVGKSLEAVRDMLGGVQGIPIELPAEQVEQLFPLFTIMTNVIGEDGNPTDTPLTSDDYERLTAWDGITLINAFNTFVPNSAAATDSPTN